MIVAIHQPQFLPYLGFFHKVARCDVFVALDDVEFMKGSHQNRNLIKTASGPKWLTVPVLQRLGQPINEVVINPTDPWRRKHAATLETNYSRACYYGDYVGSLRESLGDPAHTRLCTLDLALLRWAMGALCVNVELRLSSQLGAGGEQTARLVALCKAVGADVYLSGSGGRRYIDLELFDRAGIEVRFQEFNAAPYPQLFPEQGFVPNLSVIDALFNCGPGARALIA